MIGIAKKFGRAGDNGAEERFVQLFCEVFGSEKGQYVYLSPKLFFIDENMPKQKGKIFGLREHQEEALEARHVVCGEAD